MTTPPLTHIQRGRHRNVREYLQVKRLYMRSSRTSRFYAGQIAFGCAFLGLPF